jgi:arylsulfatase A-like enzyme
MSLRNRRHFLKTTAAAALAAGCSVQPKPSTATGPKRSTSGGPNILVFLTDDHGQWAQPAYGNSEIHAPHLDRLASRGVRMTRAYTPCPVCSPARASFFTGRMPSQHGIHDWIEEIHHDQVHPGLKGQTLISELLKDAGYHTGLVGKWHCGMSRDPHRGFDRWFCYWTNQYPHHGTQNFSDQGNHIIEEGYQSELLSNRAIDFLRNHQNNRQHGDQPFFLFVGYVDTHSPHNEAPPKLVAQYKDATFRDIPDEELPLCHGRAIAKAGPPGPERKRREDYYAAVTNIDREVGRVLAELESTGQLDNTLIVYTADHGYNAGHHGIWEKGNGTNPQNFFDESIRIPCTISWPAGGVKQNITCSDAVNHCDLWATLLDVAHAKPSAERAEKINSPGVSYLRQLQGTPSDAQWNVEICEYGNARMIRDTRFKLIRRYPFGGIRFSDEMYDLKEDPRETVNRIDDAALGEVMSGMDRQMEDFFDKYTVQGHSGLDLEHQPECTAGSPWLIAVEYEKHLATQPSVGKDAKP